MNTFVRTTLERFFPTITLHYRAYKGLIRNPDSYLYRTGWMQSLKVRQPVDRDGRAIPWMNFPVVKLLGQKLTPDLNVFEFGSGQSTFYLAGRVKNITSLEYDPAWFDIVKTQAPANVRLIFKENDVDGEYCRVACAEGKLYDLIVVDGRDRVNCLKQSVSALAPGGVIILDDSDRPKYEAGIEFLRDRGFKALHVEGLKSTDIGIDRTTIFYREPNCLGL